MSQIVPLPTVCDFMSRHCVDVFDTMLAMKVSPMPGAPGLHPENRVTGSVGFAGENVTGAIYVHLSAPFANRMAATMLGLAPEENLPENDVNDVVGEAANMLTGGLKSWLCNCGSDCAMSTPAIIRGASFEVEALPDVERAALQFDCGGEVVCIEIHIKFN